MKHCFVFVFLLSAVSSALHAQNWIPLPPGDQCCYRHSDSLLISNLIKVDSQKIMPGGDLAFFLNLVVLDCDTCITFPGKLANQGQFLQKKMLRKSDEQWVFTGKHTFVLFPPAPPGASWLFDTTQNITANVQIVVEQTVLGEPDSVKTIFLSNGTTILLSKMHGILQFPDGNSTATYTLAGIPTRNLGEKLPGWKEFYDFEIGDVLEYESDVSTDPGTSAHLHRLDKRRILNRFWDADTLVYLVDQSVYRYWQWSGPPHPFFSHGITTWRIHPHLPEPWMEEGYPQPDEPWTEAYPGQFFQIHDAPNGEHGSRVSWALDTLYGLSQVFGVVSMPFGSWSGPACGLFKKPETSEDEVLPCNSCGTSFHRRHSVGLGLVSYTLSCFEFWDYGQLTGWIKNGDTTGVITPDSFFLVSTRPEPLAIPMQVAPNPSNTDWMLFFPETATEPLYFEVADMQGRLLLQGEIAPGSKEQKISGAGFPAGVYLLKIQGKNGINTLKLIRN